MFKTNICHEIEKWILVLGTKISVSGPKNWCLMLCKIDPWYLLQLLKHEDECYMYK